MKNDNHLVAETFLIMKESENFSRRLENPIEDA